MSKKEKITKIKVDLQVLAIDPEDQKKIASHLKEALQDVKEILKTELHIKMLTTWFSKQNGICLTAYIEKSAAKGKTEKALRDRINNFVKKYEWLTTDPNQDNKIKIDIYGKN